MTFGSETFVFQTGNAILTRVKVYDGSVTPFTEIICKRIFKTGLLLLMNVLQVFLNW